jgi:sporulation protein YlmC with PRC-barrel domain
MRWHRNICALVCGAAVGFGGTLMAAEPAPKATTDPAKTTETNGKVQVDPAGKILAAKTFRLNKLIGMNVRNMQGESLGTIDDFVVDVATGKVQYAAMSVGGLLGVGDKLLAVPFSELKFDHGQEEMFFVLNMAKDKIASAPGFNQNDWPDFADPKWSKKIDEHYRKTEIRTGAEEAAPRAND